ncbi:MAG: type IV pilus secretin PilQ [Deltaproteobacteria bacterium]|nr:type IV pilus secretin PilQ [Deltaproteobacteria bacterium]
MIEAREAGLLEAHRLEKSADGFVVFLGAAAKATAPQAAPQAEPRPAAPKASAPQDAPPAAAANAPVGGGSVADLAFRQEGNKSLVEITLSKPAQHVVRESSPQRFVVDLLRTSLPDKFRRALDTSAFPGPVRLVAAYARAGKAKSTDTRIVVDLRKAAPYRLDEQGNRLTVVVDGGVPEPAVPGVADVRREPQEVVVVEGKPGSAPARKEEPASAKEPGAAKGPAGDGAASAGYTGRRLSMDFMDADIRNVLRLIGEVSGLNMVTGDDVQGKVTLRLVDVPWDQALEVILKTKGLDLVREGNVIRIAPADKLTAERNRARDAEKGTEEKAPLVSDIISVNYATASELLDKVKAVLTARGSIAVDQRTNSLLVKDVAEKLKEAKKLVMRLDTPTPQVLIEARIVEVSTNYSKDLGVQWGGRYNADAAHGNATNWAFPNSIGVAGSTGTGNFAVNFPAAVSAGGPGGALTISLGHVGDILNLDLRISALESSGQGRVISSPRVSTLDNRTAEISQGISIPFTTSTQEKIETKSIDYMLKLNVTPHVTADKSIIMKINLTKDAPSNTYVAVDSKTPAKETRAATTEVLVKDGETTVIGGIITDDKSDVRTGTPFLSKIPWLGALFRNTVNKDSKTELVIFITPKILNPSPLVGNL